MISYKRRSPLHVPRVLSNIVKIIRQVFRHVQYVSRECRIMSVINRWQTRIRKAGRLVCVRMIQISRKFNLWLGNLSLS